MTAATTEPARMTAAEFLARPPREDGLKEELIDGEIVVADMSQPRPKHGYVQLTIGMLLRAFVGPRKLGWVHSECGVILSEDSDTVTGPDVVFFSRVNFPTRPETTTDIFAD